ncbi:RepA leader peptide Tap [Pantoea sp. VS1]|nr:RepA leader peptide Tap [Pantoea sp. VS1]
MIFLSLATQEKTNGAHLFCIEAVALCGEYSFMPGKLQYLLSLLLLCNISAGRRG